MTTTLDGPLAPIAPHGPLTLGVGETVQEDAHILDKLEAHFNRYIFSASDSTGKLLTLWTAHTYFMEQLESSPRLHVTAPEFGSGKTTLLEHVQKLSYNPVKLDAGLTKSLLVRLTDSKRTILIDEVEKTIDPKHEAYGLVVAVVNSGYKVDGSTMIQEQDSQGNWVPRQFSTFAPIAFSGNGNKLPEDCMSRAIVLPIIRDRKGIAERTVWKNLREPVAVLRQELETWASSVTLPSSVSLPVGCVGRMVDVYEPLKMVAVAVGGDWPGFVDSLIEEELSRQEEEEDAGLSYEAPHVTLARDLFEVFEDDFMGSEAICEKLAKLNPHSWGDLNTKYLKITPHRLGKMLSTAYRISPTRTRIDGVKVRGYNRQSFVRVWETHGLIQDGASIMEGYPNKVGQVDQTDQVVQHYRNQRKETYDEMSQVLDSLGDAPSILDSQESNLSWPLDRKEW